jgi:hypothetical protein
MPVWISILILAASLTFVVWYFIIYPRRIEPKPSTY